MTRQGKRLRPTAIAAAIGAVLLAVAGCNMPGEDDRSDDTHGMPAPSHTLQSAPRDANSAVPSDVPDLPVPTNAPSTSAAPLPPGLAPPGIDQVDGRDAELVAESAAVAIWTYDTRVDSGPWDGELRAIPFLTDEYSAALRSARPAHAPGAQWDEWAYHRCHTLVTTHAVDVPGRGDDSPTQAQRTVEVTIVAVGEDGWASIPQTKLATFTLARAGAETPWRVDAVELS